MNVAIVFEIFFPVVNGVLTASLDVARNMRQKGHSVILIAPRLSEPGPESVEGFPVYYMKSYEVYVYPGMRGTLPWSRTVETVLRRESVDIVQATGPWLLNYAAMRAARRMGIPVVQTFHTMLLERSYIRYFTHGDLLVPVLQKVGWRYFSIYMNKSDVVTGPSQYTTSELRKAFPSLRVEYIPNSIDVARIAQAHPDRGETFDRYPDLTEHSVVFIGRLGEEKNVGLLIDSMKRVNKIDPSIRLLLVGDGPGRPAYEKQVKSLGLTEAVRFLGRIPHEELLTGGLLHHVRANVTASVTESFGMTVVEAMAAGTPSVVPQVPGISELTTGTGLSFTRDSHEEFAHEIVRIATDDDLRTSLSEACQERAPHFDGKKVSEQFIELYNELLARR